MSVKKKYVAGSSIRKHIDFILMDFLILEFSYFLAVLWYHYEFDSSLIVFGERYRLQCLILFVCLAASLTFRQPYKNILKRDKWHETTSTLKHSINMAILDIILMYVMKDTTSTSRLTFAATWVIYFALENSCRLLWKRVVRNYIVKHKDSRRQVAVLTTQKRSALMENNLGLYIFRDYDICGIFFSDFQKERDSDTTINGRKVLGGCKEIIEYAVHNWVDEVIIDIPDDHELAWKLDEKFSTMGIPTHHTVTIVENTEDDMSSDATYVEKMGNYIVITHTNREIAPIQVALKRLLDIIGGIIGSIFALIIIICVGPIIKKQAPGPVIFSQERVGKNGKTFKMYKIRSMYVDAEERKAALMEKNKMDGFMFKMDDDPRIIGSEKKDENGNPKGIGNFIRKTSLDEFPQFFNVLKGDMSIVGTRPPTMDEWNKYSVQYRKRLSIKPGITGLWQISGRSQITNFNDVVRLDSTYIDNWTVGMDVRIIIKTITKVVKREGAE